MFRKEGLLQARAHAFANRLDAQACAHNSGIDLLRLVSMFYIVIVHTVNRGGVFGASIPGTSQFVCTALIRALTMTCVDIFALISGFVGYSDEKKPVRITPLLKLYLQTVSCGLVAAAVFVIVHPLTVSLKDFILPFFPLMDNQYWYYTAYVGLFLLMPLLNAALRHTPKRTLRVTLFVLFAVFSVYNAVFDRFDLDNGYTVLWLVLLYVMGGILKKCEIGRKLRPWMAFSGIVFLTAIVWLWSLFGPQLDIFGIRIDRGLLLPYTSPAILAAAALYVIGFSKLRCGRFAKRLAAFALPSVFSVYLFNENRLIRENWIGHRFAYLGTASLPVLLGTVIGFSLAFVAASVLIDRVRVWLFDLLQIPQMLSEVDRAAHKLVEKHIPNN